MEAGNVILIVLNVILILVPSTVSAKIQLYGDTDNKELLLNLSLTGACYNIPSDKRYVHSVKTDTCIISYDQPNCRAFNSHKYMPGKTSYHSNIWTRSLQICNYQEGGPRLNFYITSHFEEKHPVVIPKVLESYYGVCSCVNVPNFVQNMSAWSVDNHHNGLYAYFEQNCTEQYSEALYIDAGHSSNSRQMHAEKLKQNGTAMNIKSLGPNSSSMYFNLNCRTFREENSDFVATELPVFEPKTGN